MPQCSRPFFHAIVPMAAVRFGLISLLAVGCGDAPAIRRYTVPRENPHDLTSDVLRRQFPFVPFRWQVPDSWQPAANDQFSMRAWQTGSAGTAARITVGRFPARTGIPAQVIRWRRQLGLDTQDAEEAMNHVSELKTKNGTGSFVEIDGTRESIFAFILPIDDDFWIIRFRGPSDIAASQRDVFRSFCRSIEYAAPPDEPGGSSDSPSAATQDEAPDTDVSPSSAGD